MNYKIIFTMLCVGLGLQGCSLFNQSECNNQQVTDRVKKLYSSQVNISFGSKLNQLTQQFNPNANKTTKTIPSIEGITLTKIKRLNLEKLQADKDNQDSQNLIDLITDRFEGAQYICQGVIQQEISTNVLADMTKELLDKDSNVIEENKLNIPVIYALYQHNGNQQFEVQYTAQNPLHLMLAIMLQKKQAKMTK
ncbi:hypothetical protein [Acinetobacter sp. AG3]|jgi:hypothetical protein|uniref:hypothetical protein n=2 Tax=unclassified Acinetobacter TaxID=196816 RepID=UPI001EF0C053|nr:hypothetical protein [Acinetobacter sp. AG3]MCG7220673.1 hypothetical protein [Acinetobacter sp. AG3]